MSRKSPETGVRVFNNIRRNEMAITRHAFTGDASVVDYLEAFDVDLLLTTNSLTSNHCRGSQLTKGNGSTPLTMSRMTALAVASSLTFATGCAGLHPEHDEPPSEGCEVLAQDRAWAQGVSLAGGGTKAASYAMGVLAALARGKGTGDPARSFLHEIDSISSVSGGSYAAFFFYSKLLVERHHGNEIDRPEHLKAYFEDCIPRSYALPSRGRPPILRADAAPDLENRLCMAAKLREERNPAFRYQIFVRCRQDVIEGDCDLDESELDPVNLANVAVLGGATLAAVLPQFVIRSIFDWPFSVSPTRHVYREGIGTAYGLYPKGPKAYRYSQPREACLEDDAFYNCEKETLGLLDKGLEIRDMASVSFERGVPVWVINATAHRSRSLFGWAGSNKRNFAKYAFQLTSHCARSGFHGEFDLADKSYFDVGHAVGSSAAFLDANQSKFGQPGRMAIAAGLHFLALDWGEDVPNPNVPLERRRLHSFLPFPLYFLDGAASLLEKGKANESAAYVRLSDGGNSDNLGAYAPIEAGVRTLLVSDHAQDDKGQMEDVCLLHNELMLRKKMKLILPGLAHFSDSCAAYLDQSEPPPGKSEAMETPGRSRYHYPIWDWKYPVIAGCVMRNAHARDCWDGERVTRILLLKPGFQLKRFRDEQLDSLGSVKRCGEGAAIPCETAAYLARRIRAGENVPRFPQNSTVSMTIDSGSNLYGAYRDLAASQTEAAIKLMRVESEFDRALERQCRAPLPRKPREPWVYVEAGAMELDHDAVAEAARLAETGSCVKP